MNEAGVFGRFIPDFGRVVAQMQYDMYHHYTVDEHTLFAIGIVRDIESGQLKDELPLASALAGTIVSRRALYLAVLLHDIAKGRGGDHSVLGEQVALKLGPRLELTAEETETVAWLVRWHLLMSGTAFKRDIGDPRTIEDFVGVVQSPERLKLLLILTVADIRAVGPQVWNGWKAALLRDLYHRAVEVMSGGLTVEPQDARVAAAQAAARAQLPDFSDAEFADFAKAGYPFYWLSFDAETHARHARLMREAAASGAPLVVEKHVERAARRDRDHALHRRPSGTVFADRGGTRGQRRQHRQRPDHDDVERHGARHLLGPGSVGQRVRPPGQARPARGGL